MITVIGIGAGGWEGLAGEAREAVLAAELLVGGERQLALVGDHVDCEKRPWPRQLTTLVDELAELGQKRAVVVLASGDGWPLARAPGLTDDSYEHDGSITDREQRAVVLAALMPVPGQLLWDIGAGSGSVAIEWLRAAPGSRAIAIERDPDRAAQIARNALHLGVPALHVLSGEAPGALDELTERPDAIFIGGGLTHYGLVTRCRKALRRGGRLVATVSTVEGETILSRGWAEQGGRLTRLASARAESLDGATAWISAPPVTLWELRVR